jgi:hypothetical protein
MEENETPDPIDISLFRADGIMFSSDRLANLVEEFWGGRIWHAG